jgi:cytochrome c biogenesis protein ResB
MVYLAVLAFVGTLVPQGPPTAPKVVAWTASNPAAAAFVRGAGLHSAYATWYFLAGALLLSASTAVCAWQRTSVAMKRFGLCRRLRLSKGTVGYIKSDYAVRVGADSFGPQGLAQVGSSLGKSGLKLTERDGSLVSASWPYFALGSALFHWCLLLLFCALFAGALLRSDGLMGVPVGETRPDAPESYGILRVGPLHQWPGTRRTIGVEDLKLAYSVDGMDRGPAPLVVVRDDKGKVLARQFVYPNAPLKMGALIVHPNDYGLSVAFALVGADGVERDRSTQLVDFPVNNTGPAGPADIVLTGDSPEAQIEVTVTVPLERRGASTLRAIPSTPSAMFEYASHNGKAGSETLMPGQELTLPDGSKIRLLKVGYYARLSVVDDPTVPAVYISLVAGLVGLTIALLGTQRAVVLTLVRDDDGARIDVTARLWRNPGISSAQLKAALEESVAEYEGKQKA